MAVWLRKTDVMQALGAHKVPDEFINVVEKIPGVEGEITRESRWLRLAPDDPRMDADERVLFPDEVYCCAGCGAKEYFGAGCKRGRYCQRCGARMANAGDRKLEDTEGKIGA